MTRPWSYRGISHGMIVVALLAVPIQAAAQPSSAAACSGCHAPVNDGPVPGLIGRPAGEIVTAMAAFRAGERTATVMDRIAKGYSDEEINAIAQWYAAQGQPAGNP
ncbi:cytochrome c [Taklimakanibacter lacteus]|uniref:cytochrome c n=1 Tax=Taklimakanibacter lacteus TaxID=2268456 RepID=UPI0034D42E9F